MGNIAREGRVVVAVRRIGAGWDAAGHCLVGRSPCKRARFRNGAPDDLRLAWPVVRLAGFSGYDRLGAGIPVRIYAG